MAIMLVCPRGHSWELVSDGFLADRKTCPVCGAQGSAASPADGADATLDFDPDVTLGPESTAGVQDHRLNVPGYEVIRELGRGGMGVVYLARQAALDRLVAVKMLLAGRRASEPELARFRGEALAVARLRHPNIVQVFDVGEHDGHAYFALEYVEGGSLADHLVKAPWPPRRAAELVETLARAMHAAHEAGVVHRDLKPANVLMADDRTPKVTDFGLAKLVESDAGLTGTGAILGTPAYMAPEQAAGRGKHVGPAADVYALGAILYELLAGRPPFVAATPLDVVMQVASAPPAPPSEFRGGIPAALEAICLKCLQKSPRGRYASAEALADDLKSFLEGAPVAASPAPPRRKDRWWDLRGWLVPVVFVSGLWVGGLTCLVNAFRTPSERELGMKALWKGARPLVAVAPSGALAAARVADHTVAWRSFDGGKEAARAEFSAAVTMLRFGSANDLLLGFEDGSAEVRDLKANVPRLRVRHPTSSDAATSASTDETRIDFIHLSSDGATLTTRNRVTGLLVRWNVADGRQVSSLQKRGILSSDARIVIETSGGAGVVWDAATGDKLGTFAGRALAVLPRQAGIVVQRANGAVEVVDDAGAARATLGKLGPVREVVPAADGAGFATREEGGPIRVWGGDGKLTGAREIRSQQLDALLVGGQVLTRDDAETSRDAKKKGFHLRLWDAASGQLLREGRARRLVGLTPDGSRLVVDTGRSLELWDGVSRHWVAGVQHFTGYGLFAALLLFPATIITAIIVQAFRESRRLDSTEAAVLSGHTDTITHLAFSPDGSMLASCSLDKTLRLWDAADGACRHVLDAGDDDAFVVAFSGDGKYVAAIGAADEVRCWEVDSGRMSASLAHPAPVGRIAFAGAPTLCTAVALDSEEGYATIHLWDAATGRRIVELPGGADFAASPGGDAVAVVSKGHVHFYSTETGWETQQRETGLRDARALIYSPDGRLLALMGEEVRVMDVTSWREEGAFQLPHGSKPLAVQFEDGGRRLLIVVEGERKGLDGTVEWDLRTDEKSYGRSIDYPAPAPVAGRRIVLGPDGSKVVVEDAATKEKIAVLRGHRKWITANAYSPDGQLLATGSQDQTVRLWDLDAVVRAARLRDQTATQDDAPG